MRRKQFILFLLMTFLCSSAAWANEEGEIGVGQGDGTFQHPYTGVWDIMMLEERIKVGDYLDQNCEIKEIILTLEDKELGSWLGFGDDINMVGRGWVWSGKDCNVGDFLDEEKVEWYSDGFYRDYIKINPRPDREKHLFRITSLDKWLKERPDISNHISCELRIHGLFTGVYKIPDGSSRAEEYVKQLNSLKNQCPVKLMTDDIEKAFTELEGTIRSESENNDHVVARMEQATDILLRHIKVCYEKIYDELAEGISAEYVTDIVAECKNDLDISVLTNRTVRFLAETGENNMQKLSAAVDFYKQGVVDGILPNHTPTLPGSRMKVTLKDGKAFEFNVRDLKEDVQYIEVTE